MTTSEPVRPVPLARLDALVGEWVQQVELPGAAAGSVTFEWILGGQFLLQRSEIPDPHFPDSVSIIALADRGYTQHYFDSRGVVRTYAMTLDEHTWTLLREQPDSTALDFSQRFNGSFSSDGTSITATWETRGEDQQWRKDFGLTYTRRAARP